MKIIKSSANALTNFEVLDLLRSRGAGKDPTRLIASVSSYEFKAFDYLEQTTACNQTRDSIHKLVDECLTRLDGRFAHGCDSAPGGTSPTPRLQLNLWPALRVIFIRNGLNKDTIRYQRPEISTLFIYQFD